MAKIYIGIDPGQKGGIAVINGNLATAYPYSNEVLQETLLWVSGEDCLLFIEQVHSMPSQGVVSTFKFGQSFGYILGAIEANKIPYETISPRRWKNHFGLNEEKKKSIQTAKKLFPNVSLRASARCRVDNDGMAEALLIALYGKRRDGNG